jgi:hypothetical protein
VPLEAVPDEGDEREPPRRLRARGVPALATWVSALVVLVLLAGLVIAVVVAMKQL